MKILGTNTTGQYAKVTNEVLETTPWETVYEEDPTLAPGKESVKTTPYTGYKVNTYHTIYAKDGKVIDTHFEAASNYKVRNKVILRGPAAAAVEPETPSAGVIVTPAEPKADAPEEDNPAFTPIEPEAPAVTAPEEETPGFIVIPTEPEE